MEKELRIYLCSRYGRRKEMLRRKKTIEEMGHVVTSRWIEGDHEAASVESKTASLPTLEAQKFAKADLFDLKDSDVIICFTERADSPHGRGGRHVEFGLALGTAHMRIIVIGPTENVFYSLNHENLLRLRKWEIEKIKLFLEGIKLSRTDIMLGVAGRQKRIITGGEI